MSHPLSNNNLSQPLLASSSRETPILMARAPINEVKEEEKEFEGTAMDIDCDAPNHQPSSSLSTMSPQVHYFDIDGKRKRSPSRLNFSHSSSAPRTSASKWNDNIKSLLLRKLRNNNNQSSELPRYIARDKDSTSNLEPHGVKKSSGMKMLYHKLIDQRWVWLISEFFALYTVIYALFASVFYALSSAYNAIPENPKVSELYEDNYWMLCFDFAVHSGTSIGYGYLLPHKAGFIAGFAMIFFIYVTEVYLVVFLGTWTEKFAKPSRLKTQIRFSDVAVINQGYSTTSPLPAAAAVAASKTPTQLSTSLKFQSFLPRHQYSDFEYEQGTIHDVGDYAPSHENDKYQCLMFRFCHIRPQSRMCRPNTKLLYHARATDARDTHYHEELEFELYRKRGRMRSSQGPDMPLLSLPWTVVHKIDESSPLYGMSAQDMSAQDIEIIAVIGGIDEITSDNFQAWWSYKSEEIFRDHYFEPMVHCKMETKRPWYYYFVSCFTNAVATKYREILEIDFDRLSLISSVTRYTYT